MVNSKYEIILVANYEISMMEDEFEKYRVSDQVYSKIWVMLNKLEGEGVVKQSGGTEDES